MDWCLTLCDPTDCSLPVSSVPGDSPGKTIGMGCHALLQGIFPTQGLKPSPRGTLSCRGTFGCRGKAVRERFALQGGTGDFP